MEINNTIIYDSFVKADSIINNPQYNKIVVSLSGGSDSDIMIDIIHRVSKRNNIRYVWFNTGLEYKATIEHLDYLEKRYGIKIERLRPQKPIPLCVKEFGQPFVSKYVSEQIRRLQSINFEWIDEPYEVLLERYPSQSSALKWWCNEYKKNSFNINYNKYLKEFLISNPPSFAIDNKCCDYAKKKVSHSIDYDIMCIGVRKAEGGIRAEMYKTCFNVDTGKYLPIFWYSDADKKEYEELFDIKHSKLYTEYGMKRTGCIACPYGGRDAFKELKIVEEHEPNIYKACMNIFGDAYEYYKAYQTFYNKKKYEFFVERGNKNKN